MKHYPWIFGLIMLIGVGASIVIALGGDLDVVNPSGYIAQQELNIIIFALMLSLLVIVPVFAITIYISIKYRASNTKAQYLPNWDADRRAESIWWGIPLVLIVILSIITWQSTFALDPYKPLESDKEPLTIQAVALEWKWLFIYPDLNIASVNQLNVPVDVPLNFEITADAPMNSLWIPALGGQVYAMKGMQTKLHLLAEEEGVVVGRSSNISGEGFAKMVFNTNMQNQSEFDQWASEVSRNGYTLNMSKYEGIAKPGVIENPIFYTDVEPRLFNTVMDKYMHGGH